MSAPWESTDPILAIETSCDETSAAVVIGRKVLSNVVSSQVELHRKWGGIVPEAAARAHVESILPVIEQALADSGVGLGEISAFAATNRPGLVGALSVGVTAAKALAFARSRPMYGVHHLEGHIVSPFATFSGDNQPIEPIFPHMCLIVSGGHTELVWVEAPRVYKVVGQTIDDAAGEAFDKAARLLGLGYPGGAALAELALNGNPSRYKLPRGKAESDLDVSFSGLKTAVMRLVEAAGQSLERSDAAASLQQAIVDALNYRVAIALDRFPEAKAVTLVGGVAANYCLRAAIGDLCHMNSIPFLPAPTELCTDNAAMIGLAAGISLALRETDGPDIDVFASAPLPSQ